MVTNNKLICKYNVTIGGKEKWIKSIIENLLLYYVTVDELF